MNYAEYTPLAIRTARLIDADTDLAHAYMGIITEIGELVDGFKRHIIYGKPLDLVNLSEEIGDVFWYLALLAEVTKTSLAEPYDMSKARKEDSPKLTKFLFSLSYNAGGVAVGNCRASLVQHQVEALAWLYDIDVGTCLDKNIAKLVARYGDKYSDYAALNRDLAVERVALS